MNLGEIGENGQLKIVQNVNELHDVWNGLKEDEQQTEKQKESSNFQNENKGLEN